MMDASLTRSLNFRRFYQKINLKKITKTLKQDHHQFLKNIIQSSLSEMENNTKSYSFSNLRKWFRQVQSFWHRIIRTCAFLSSQFRFLINRNCLISEASTVSRGQTLALKVQCVHVLSCVVSGSWKPSVVATGNDRMRCREVDRWRRTMLRVYSEPFRRAARKTSLRGSW